MLGNTDLLEKAQLHLQLRGVNHTTLWTKLMAVIDVFRHVACELKENCMLEQAIGTSTVSEPLSVRVTCNREKSLIVTASQTGIGR